jgi:hypothetical protein
MRVVLAAKVHLGDTLYTYLENASIAEPPRMLGAVVQKALQRVMSLIVALKNVSTAAQPQMQADLVPRVHLKATSLVAASCNYQLNHTMATTKKRKAEEPVRFRAARSDASVSSISRRIERDYQLPVGSVRIVSPSGRRLNDESTIGILLVKWAKAKG